MTVFEDYLKEAVSRNGEIRLVPSLQENTVSFYAHIINQDSQTIDMVVKGNQLEPLMGAGEFASVIFRDPLQVNGPGTWFLFCGSQLVDFWPCITGEDKLDEFAYGGLTPRLPSGMIMKYEIQEFNDRYNKQDHAAWIPAVKGEEKEYCPKRTWWNVAVDEFRVHQVGVNKAGVVTGRSTGCTCPLDHVWEHAKKQLNKAYRHAEEHDYSFVTFVRNYGEENPLVV